MELVASLRPTEDIGAAYGYTEAQLATKLKKRAFQVVLREAKQLWNSDTNIRERVRLKAGMLVEDSLLDIYGIVTDDSVSANTRNASFQSLTRVAAVDSPDKGGVEGNSFKVVVNLPGNSTPISLENVIEHEDE